MGEGAPPAPLKLRAHGVADMDVIAACVQDALVPLRDIRWMKREKRFVMVLNRFLWERAGKAALDVDGGAEGTAQTQSQGESGADAAGGAAGDASFEDADPRPVNWRSNAALVFDKVRRVQTQGVDLTARDQFLNLLTIASEPKCITLHFSEGARIRLDLADIRCHLTDLGEPWPTWSVPEHREAAEAD